ncbi:MAG: tyrosine-type recombinase/integrase [Desulfomonilaceae bacterium]
MSVTRRGKVYHLRIRPFGPALITVRTRAQTKMEALRIERAVLNACESGDYRSLDPASRAVCIAMFRNRGLEILPDLSRNEPVKEELTMWKAVDLFLNYPEIRESPTRWRYVCALTPLVKYFGKDRSIKTLWIPDVKAYRIERLNKGASPATVNREISTLSKLFGVLIEMQAVEVNPVRQVRRLSEKSGERQVYLGSKDFQAIMDKCPEWFRPIALTAYYTGMRRGEILGLTRKQVNLSSRIITLYPVRSAEGGDKEARWKRIPIHEDLVPILRAVLEGPPLISGKIFHLRDHKGVRDLGRESFKNCWPRACKALELEKPWPRFHDLRHTWKTNARRSGMDPEITDAILGHSLANIVLTLMPTRSAFQA